MEPASAARKAVTGSMDPARIRYPERGSTTSLGTGRDELSSAMSASTPRGPHRWTVRAVAEITQAAIPRTGTPLAESKSAA